jgi:Xaa-Pro aminopeptidase
MLPLEVHAARRQQLSARVGRPILLLGNGTRIRNIPIEHLPFRQDSSFLFFTGCARPDAALLLVDGHATLFVEPPADDDALWHGYSETLEDIRAAYGVDQVASVRTLAERCAGLELATIAVPDSAATVTAATLAGVELDYGTVNGDPALIDAIIELRRCHTPLELDLHRAAARVTTTAFHASMSGTHVGGNEAHIAALFDGVLAAHGFVTGYPSIVTVRGEVLHNPYYRNPLLDGQLLLLDGGGEGPEGYGVDITRTWPVNGRFSVRQRDAYQAVLASQLAGIDQVRAGVRYRDIHMGCSRVLAQWLLDEGLLRGTLDQVCEAHAAAVFFPHGVGHLLGMDVHDLEQFGDRAAYAPGRSRDPHFGTAYLRMDLDLEPGMLVTIEPGFYVVPAILNDPALRETFGDLVDWDAAQSWLGFGGIRIEDDVLCTGAGAPEVLTAAVPKTVAALEAVVGSGRSALERLS